MRFLSADIIFPITTEPITNGIVAVNANGTIAEVMAPDDANAPDSSRIERYSGALCPGFVNAHCHLELSHMKGLVPEKTGLPKFIMQIVSRRNERAELKMEAIRAADEEMWQNGIQAVGDICNTVDTLETKKNSRISYHSFVEVFSIDPAKADDVLKEGIRVAQHYKENGLLATIVPHAPYSVSERLFEGIRAQQIQFPGTVSIHNQETESENDMFVSGDGKLVDLFRDLGADLSGLRSGFKSSLDYHFTQLPSDQRIVLVHNTMTRAEDIQALEQLRKDIFWCACVQANRYIEDRIPAIDMWLQNGAKLCIGTDSLASNHQLSVLEELKLIAQNVAPIPMHELLKAATLNGARALNMEKEKGSFQKGKLPGVLWLSGLNAQGHFTAATSVQRIF